MNNLRNERIKAGLSQTQLAAKVGVSTRHIAFVESGDRTPSLDLAIMIASVLGKTIDEIFYSKNVLKVHNTRSERREEDE